MNGPLSLTLRYSNLHYYGITTVRGEVTVNPAVAGPVVLSMLFRINDTDAFINAAPNTLIFSWRNAAGERIVSITREHVTVVPGSDFLLIVLIVPVGAPRARGSEAHW